MEKEHGHGWSIGQIILAIVVVAVLVVLALGAFGSIVGGSGAGT